MARQKIRPSIGSTVVFMEDYPIYHIAKGQKADVRELLGETHANVFVPTESSGFIIAIPLSDLGNEDNAVVVPSGE